MSSTVLTPALTARDAYQQLGHPSSICIGNSVRPPFPRALGPTLHAPTPFMSNLFFIKTSRILTATAFHCEPQGLPPCPYYPYWLTAAIPILWRRKSGAVPLRSGDDEIVHQLRSTCLYLTLFVHLRNLASVFLADNRRPTTYCLGRCGNLYSHLRSANSVSPPPRNPFFFISLLVETLPFSNYLGTARPSW